MLILRNSKKLLTILINQKERISRLFATQNPTNSDLPSPLSTSTQTETLITPKDLFIGNVSLLNSKLGPIKIGVVDVKYPGVADAISNLLVRSISDARQSNNIPGHLPDHLVDYVIQNYISPEKVQSLWAPYGQRMVMQLEQNEIVGTVHVASSPETILYYDRFKHNVSEKDYPNFKPYGYHHIMNLSVKHELRKIGLAKILLQTIAKDFRHLFHGAGLWMRADPPWHNKLAKLGFKHDPSMDSFLGEQAEKTLELSHLEYNQQHECQCIHPKPENPASLFSRAQRLKKEKLQYLSFTYDFLPARSHYALPVNDLAMASAATILKFFQYKLDTAPNGFKFDTPKVLEEFKRTFCHNLAEKKLGLYYSTLRSIIESLYPLSETEQQALEKAERFTKYDIQMEGLVIVENMPIPTTNSIQTPYNMRDNSDIQQFKVEDVEWHRIDEYVVDRIGPVHKVIDELQPTDELIVSNLGIDSYLSWLNTNSKKETRQVERLSLPVSSYEKEIWLIRFSDQTQTLLFSKIKGDNYLLHYRLLIQRYFLQKGHKTRLGALISTESVNNDDVSLSSFVSQNKAKLKNLSSLVFGYAPVFELDWPHYLQETIRDPQNQWRADIYKLNGTSIAVLSTRLPMHGEILARNFCKALYLLPEIRHLFIAGSAGSLSARIPYEMVFPYLLTVPSSQRTIKNILAAESHPTEIHASVPSPLVETPQFLAKLSKEGIKTIDMEVGFLAELPSQHPHISIGLGVIPTDFPKHTSVGHSVTLFTKIVTKHNQARHSFPAAIHQYLMHRRGMYHSEFEKQFGSIKERSAINLLSEKERLGTLSPLEIELKIKLMRELKLGFSIRLSLTRLWQSLGDKVFLSPKLIEEFAPRKANVTSPMLENQIFGAHQYIFGEIGVGTGSEQYGSVVIKVKDSCWKNASWATKYSGWWATQKAQKQYGRFFISPENTISDQADLKQAQDQFNHWVFEPAHYSEAIALMVLSHLRGKSQDIFLQFLYASTEELTNLIQLHNFAKLEGKIYQSLEFDDLEKVLLPPDASPELVARLQQCNIPFEGEILARNLSKAL